MWGSCPPLFQCSLTLPLLGLCPDAVGMGARLAPGLPGTWGLLVRGDAEGPWNNWEENLWFVGPDRASKGQFLQGQSYAINPNNTT